MQKSVQLWLVSSLTADPVLCSMVWQNLSLCASRLKYIQFSMWELSADFMCAIWGRMVLLHGLHT